MIEEVVEGEIEGDLIEEVGEGDIEGLLQMKERNAEKKKKKKKKKIWFKLKYWWHVL